jgi:hypothetical protein
MSRNQVGFVMRITSSLSHASQASGVKSLRQLWDLVRVLAKAKHALIAILAAAAIFTHLLLR